MESQTKKPGYLMPKKYGERINTRSEHFAASIRDLARTYGWSSGKHVLTIVGHLCETVLSVDGDGWIFSPKRVQEIKESELASIGGRASALKRAKTVERTPQLESETDKEEDQDARARPPDSSESRTRRKKKPSRPGWVKRWLMDRQRKEQKA